jgi:signal transduction histidine kinase
MAKPAEGPDTDLAESRTADASDFGELERVLFRHSQDGMLLIKVEREVSGALDFRILAENPAAISRLGLLGQDKTFAGQNIKTAFPTWLARQVDAHYSACVSTGEARRYEISQPNGALAHESIATPVISPQGDGIAYIAVTMRDIAERVSHERELNIALARAEEANRSKSEFFASMSHELRTPLNAILGFSEMMEKNIGGTLNDRHRQYVDHIHSSGQHLLRIISDILDLSKIEAGQFTLQESDTSLPPLAEICVQMIQDRAGRKGLKVICDIAPDLPTVFADPVRIKQILLNLLSNAVKFTERGSLTLAIRHQPESGFEISVSDTGIGMNVDELKIALEPFGQVQDAYTRNNDGTGLGLPITRHLAELHGGRLELTSKKGAGTCATVHLPAARAVTSDTKQRATA